MDFAPTEAQKALIVAASDFADALGARFGGNPVLSRELWRFWGSEGWLGLCIPAAHGGGDADALSAVLAFEAMGRAGVSRSQLFGVGAHLFGCAMAIARHGTPEQGARWLPLLAGGEAVGALAFSEPTGGSDLTHCRTLLEREGDGVLLEGRKALVTNGCEADLFLVLARASWLSPPLDVSSLLVPRWR